MNFSQTIRAANGTWSLVRHFLFSGGVRIEVDKGGVSLKVNCEHEVVFAFPAIHTLQDQGR